MSTLPSGPRAVDFVELQATPDRPKATAVKTSIEVLIILSGIILPRPARGKHERVISALWPLAWLAQRK